MRAGLLSPTEAGEVFDDFPLIQLKITMLGQIFQISENFQGKICWFFKVLKKVP